MGLVRKDIIKKINIFSSEENKEELIKLLCEIINDENYIINNEKTYNIIRKGKKKYYVLEK